MKILDPLRPRLGNGTPAWLGAPSIALPIIGLSQVEISGCGYWRVEILLPRQRNEFGWECRNFASSGVLAGFLEDWAADPEEALQRWFGQEPPQFAGALAEETETAPEAQVDLEGLL